MNFEKLLEWGAIIVLAILLIRWLAGALSQSIATPSAASYAGNPYGMMGPGLVYLNPPNGPLPKYPIYGRSRGRSGNRASY